MTTWRDQVEQVCERGNQLLEDGRPDEAVQTYDQAWDLLPAPRFSRPEATWILASIGDVQMQRGGGLRHRPGGLECLHALPRGDRQPVHPPAAGAGPARARQHRPGRGRADARLHGGGLEIFAMEDERYLDFLASRAPGIERPEAVELDLP